MYRPTSYFIYQGEKMGFQYELAEQFAHSLGLKLQVKTARNMKELVLKLQKGEGDIIAFDLPFTKENKDHVIFCGEQVVTHQVIVQRKGHKRKILTDVTQLIGKDVYVERGRYFERMENLNKELGGGIRIHEVKSDSITIEDLITQVAEGRIDYTVADNDEAMLNKTYYENLDVSLAVSFDQRSSWVVRKDCPLLAAMATRWHKENMSSAEHEASMKRYFEISKQLMPGHYLFKKNRLSPYDQLFKRYAKKIDWDWRLLAALAYKESNFDPSVVSWAGARGLMQLMPLTARLVGLPRGKENNPEQSIKAAVKYISITQQEFSMINNSHERLQFVLATYNAGINHINDAMALADKYGKSKYKWRNNVEKFILLKSNEKYYTDPVCKYGYFRGIETYNFVRDILDQYKEFKIKTRK
jgi:membrane-bound lytic murein transglycosylase F